MTCGNGNFPPISVFLQHMLNAHSFYLILAYIASAFTIIPFIIALLHRNYLSKEFKILWLLVTCSLLTEITSSILVFIFKTSNVQLFNCYIIIETIIISLFYVSIIENKLWRILFSVFCASFSIYSSVQLITSSIKTLDYVFLTVESLMVILFSIVAFHNILKFSKYNSLLSAPIFWINSAFLLFFSGNLFLHLFSQYLQEFAQKAFYELWGFHSLFNIIFYSLISIAFWKTKTSQISNS